MKPRTFKEWQAFAAKVNARADKLQSSLHEQGWKLAATVGIPHDTCCLHNASIDDALSGWCHKNPERLKVAKQANHIINDWSISQKARRIISKAWDHMAKLNGMAHSNTNTQ